MRSRRLLFILSAFYLVFIGGSAYYTLAFPIRIFHHAFMTLLLALWLFGRVRSGKGLPTTPLNPAIYAMVALWGLSAVFSIDRRMAFENLWFLILHTILFFILVDYFQRGRHKLVMETQFILAATVVLISGLEIASWYFGLNVTPDTQVGWLTVIGPDAWLPLRILRLALAMSISTLLAGYVAPLITLAIGWALTTRRDYRQVLFGLAAALFVILVLTFSRGGLLSLAAALGTFMLMRFAQNRRLQGRNLSLILIGAGAAVGVIGITLFMIITLSPSRSSGDQVRVDMLRSAVAMTQDYPLLGVGPGIYGRAFRDYRSPELARDRLASAHNLYLNTSAETGLLGAIIGLGLGGLLVQCWWRTWKNAASDGERIRLEATIAALIGVAVHSLVDVFTTTPLVVLFLVLIAYSITGIRSALTPQPRGQRWPALVGLVLIVGYGLWFIQIDQAHIHYQKSFVGGEAGLEEARAAERRDPVLNLYDLQIAFLIGQDPNADLSAKIGAYEDALELEPSWDTGWINLAALVANDGDAELAVIYLERALAINPLTVVRLNLARLSENASPDDEVLTNYTSGLQFFMMTRQTLPLSPFWRETELRSTALDNYVAQLPLDWRYRYWAEIDPEVAYALVTPNPTSAAEFWVAGEYTLNVENDPSTAADHFSRSIALGPTNGDYYASRARATRESDLSAAQRDIDLATLLGTTFEYPYLIRAQLTENPDEVRLLLATSLRPRSVPQEFAAVLYGGRMSNFDLFPEMRYPGPGREAMQPWYTLAEQFLAEDNTEQAITVYQAIVDYAPDETEARDQVTRLEAEAVD